MIEGDEARFSSLAAAGEFVRRAYVRGSAGDGGGAPGTGGEPQGRGPQGPRLEDSERVRQEWPSEPSPALAALMRDMASFKKLVETCNIGEAGSMMWTTPSMSGHYPNESEVLMAGGAHVLRDTVERWLADLPDASTSPFGKLGMVLNAMNLDTHEVWHYFTKLYPTYEKLLDFDLREEMRSTGWHWFWRNRDIDPLNIVSQLPAPATFGTEPGHSDLLAWLSAFVAAPINILASMPLREAFERAIFAAALLVNRREVWPPWSNFGHAPDTRPPLEQTATEWLCEHLPQMAYHPALEATIDTVADRQ